MKLIDEKVIEFFSKSPIKTFASMLDALRYLDGQRMSQDAEYELFDSTLGDNPQGSVEIRVPKIGGITANALLAFTGHAQSFHLIRRRPKTIRERNIPEEIVVFYELTASGGYAVKVLEVLTDVSTLAANEG